MSKKNPCRKKIVSIDTFNEIAADAEYRNPEFKCHITSVEMIFPEMTYEASLTGNVDDIINIANIAKQLRHYTSEEFIDIENREQYGYRKTYSLKQHKDKINWDLRDPGNFSYIDEDRIGKKLKCWSYDVNSAYSYAMTKPMPDTRKPAKLNSLVGENEIGFYKSGGVTTDVGAYAEYIFPLIESPLKNYVDNYYIKKRNAKDKFDRHKWKSFLNIASGLLHKYNIFLRLAILHYAAEYISSFIDDDTVYCNTDSIVSTKPRTDLPIGDDLGMFKEEHKNEDFKYLAVGIYQWNKECHYKGIPGCTLTDIENTTDWRHNFPYQFDKEIRRIIKNGEYAQK